MDVNKPRRGDGEGSIRKITLRSGKTVWRGQITVGYKPDGEGGKREIRRTAQREKRAAVVEALARFREAHRDGAIDPQAETTLRYHDLLDKWLAFFIATKDYKQHTPDTYKWAIAKAKTFGNPLAARVAHHELQEFLFSLDSYKQSSVKLVRVVLKGAFKRAKAWRVRADDPAEGLQLPREKTPAPDKRILSAAEGRAYLKALEAERMGLAVAFTYALAVRPGEAAAVRISDIDLDAGTLRITGTHNRIPSKGKIERETPKSTRGQRVLRIPDALVPWVTRRIERVKAERLAMGDDWKGSDPDLLFVREQAGGKANSADLYRVARRVAEACGLGTVSPRVLRRTMLSLLAAEGVDRKERAAIGGHTEIVTEAHYHEVADERVLAAMERIDGLLEEE